MLRLGVSELRGRPVAAPFFPAFEAQSPRRCVRERFEGFDWVMRER